MAATGEIIKSQSSASKVSMPVCACASSSRPRTSRYPCGYTSQPSLQPIRPRKNKQGDINHPLHPETPSVPGTMPAGTVFLANSSQNLAYMIIIMSQKVASRNLVPKQRPVLSRLPPFVDFASSSPPRPSSPPAHRGDPCFQAESYELASLLSEAPGIHPIEFLVRKFSFPAGGMLVRDRIVDA